MARTALPVQQIGRAGIIPALTAAPVDGHAIDNNGEVFLHVKTGATPTNVTIETPGTVDGQAIGDRVVALIANSEKMIGPFPSSTYNQPNRTINVNFSAV